MKLILTLLLCLLACACGPVAAAAKPPFPPGAGAVFSSLSPRSERAWQAHLAGLRGLPLQAACRPFRLPAQGTRQGSVVLLHGFSACPQQYWELAPLLAAAGFDVFAPLLPGHGLSFAETARGPVDASESLPADDGYRRYQTFAAEVADLVRDDSGRRLAVGLSVGAAVAARALQIPGAFDRALLMTPLFDVPDRKNVYLPLLNGVLPDFATDWGPGCEHERAGGRGGYCQFRIGHLRATQRLGRETLAGLDRVAARVQLVGVEGDGAANNGAIIRAARRLPFARGCFFRQGANHSLFSRYDAPDEDKFWLPALMRQTLRFVADGSFFDTGGPSSEGSLPQCAIP